MTSFHGQLWKWALAIVGLVVVGWLWVSWRGGLFSAIPRAEQTSQPTQEAVSDSLTATETPEGVSAPVFESLTPAPSSTKTPVAESPAVDPSVLDSLSAPN